jgi:phosphate/sulfate permease
MASPKPKPITASKLAKLTYKLFSISKKERNYLYLLLILTFICGIFYPYPNIAMWIAFGLAGYSAIANDSIQTIGTFISSNSHRKWYHLWLFMGLIFLVTVTYSWIQYSGDVSYQRLNTPGLDVAPETFTFLQVAAPIILLILTRLKMPVSTSILLLSAFSTKASSIADILQKSFIGYILAFVLAIVIWVDCQNL